MTWGTRKESLSFILHELTAVNQSKFEYLFDLNVGIRIKNFVTTIYFSITVTN